MADYFLSASFEFHCSNAEMALLEEAFALSADLNDDIEPAALSSEFLAAFPPLPQEDPYSGFLALFDDANFPNLGADLTGGNSLEEPAISTAHISGSTDFQPGPIAGIIQRCCQASLAHGPITFEWAETCSRLRIGGFGGGWCAVYPNYIEIQSTRDALKKAQAAKAANRADGSITDAEPIFPDNGALVGRSLLLNVPDIFADASFRQWLETSAPKFTWYRGGEPDEWSDVVVLVDPALSGEGSESDMPAHIWDRIISACRDHIGVSPTGAPHHMVRLTNLAC